MTRPRHLVFALVLTAAVVGCTGPASPSAFPPNGPDPATIRYTCDAPPGFLPALFDQPGTAEQEDHPSAAGLRELLAANTFGLGFLPDAGWWLVHRDEREAQYVTLLPDGQESPAAFVTLRSSGGTWLMAGGGNCRPQPLLEGQIPATWTLAPGQSVLDESSTQFLALVSQTGCDTGEEARRRILPPSITYTTDAVFVLIAARPFAGVNLCGGMDPTPFAVALREPLGERRLLDAGVFPPGDPNRPPP